MTMEMPKILVCNATECAYNMNSKCRAMAITVGGKEDCPVCDTAMKSGKKGGVSDMNANVGACKVGTCKFNKSLECTAQGIDVTWHYDHAECDTFKSK